MFNNVSGFKKIYLASGYVDLRRGIDGLATLIRFQFNLEPKDRNTLFLFCGKRADRLKGLVWEGDGWLLFYARAEVGGFAWPRTSKEALELTEDQFRALMKGLEVIPRHPIQDVGDKPFII